MLCNETRGLGCRLSGHACTLEAGHVERGQPWHLDSHGQRWSAAAVYFGDMAVEDKESCQAEGRAAARPLVAAPALAALRASVLPEPPIGDHWWGKGDGLCARCGARASLAMNNPCPWRPAAPAERVGDGLYSWQTGPFVHLEALAASERPQKLAEHLALFLRELARKAGGHDRAAAATLEVMTGEEQAAAVHAYALALTMPRLEALALALEVGRFIADDRVAQVKAVQNALGIW